jgi:DNA end-binding protein Ku
LVDLINKKRTGVLIPAKAAPKTGDNVINLMDALKRSLTSEGASTPTAKPKAGKRPKKRVEGQSEMLLPISGKRPKEEAKKSEKPARTPARSRKAG